VVGSRGILADIACGMLVLGVSAQAQESSSLTGKVVAIHDGDTISVLQDGRTVRVRLGGIDTPERGRAFGRRARQFTTDLVAKRVVRVEVRDYDRYGRSIGRGRRRLPRCVQAPTAWACGAGCPWGLGPPGPWRVRRRGPPRGAGCPGCPRPRVLVQREGDSASLAGLHDVLQVAFGWTGFHLYSFRIHQQEFGPTHADSHDAKLADFRLHRREKFRYVYDFGDWWEIDIRLLDVGPLAPRKKYPVCVGGKRAGPPEDCGGPDAYPPTYRCLTITTIAFPSRRSVSRGGQ
jgi:hypothetical protein